MVKKDLSDKYYKVNGEKSRTSLELSPQRNPLGKAQAMFYRAFAAAKGDEGRLESSWELVQIIDYAKIGALECRELAARCEREELIEGWKIFQKS